MGAVSVPDESVAIIGDSGGWLVENAVTLTGVIPYAQHTTVARVVFE